jgi:TPR repeat protein
MAKTLLQRQKLFRQKMEEQEGLRIDMWLPGEVAHKLRSLRAWRSLRSGPQVILSLVNDAWSNEIKNAASDGHADAQFQYAITWMERRHSSALQVAISWFEKSAAQGYRADQAYNNLGVLACVSKSYPDYKKAADWFQQSADRGNRCAQFHLWVLYTLGWGVKHNDRQAAMYLQQSAEKGLPVAQQLLGVLYALGKGVPQDCEKAIEWLRRGRHEDDSSSQNYLARWLSTFPDDEYGLRNGPVAVTIAEKLVQPRRSAEYLETLAAAYAEAGRFDDAIKTQQELLLKLKQKKSRSKYQGAAVKQCQDQIKSFMQKKPLRDGSFDIGWLYQH